MRPASKDRPQHLSLSPAAAESQERSPWPCSSWQVDSISLETPAPGWLQGGSQLWGQPPKVWEATELRGGRSRVLHIAAVAWQQRTCATARSLPSCQTECDRGAIFRSAC